MPADADPGHSTPDHSDSGRSDSGQLAEHSEQVFAPDNQVQVAQLLADLRETRRKWLGHQGKRNSSDSEQFRGHVIGARLSTGAPHDIAIAATLRASGLRHALSGSGIVSNHPCDKTRSALVSIPDLRVKARQTQSGALLLFVVDSSGSMGARKRMALVKGAILELLGDAYRKRDRVGMVVFRGEGANVLVPPTNSVELAEQRLRHLPTGGKTPLAAGLELAHQLLDTQLRQNPALAPLLILVTDGRGNVGASPHMAATALAKRDYPILVLDSEQGYVRMGDAKRLAETLNAAYASLDKLPELLGLNRQ